MTNRTLPLWATLAALALPTAASAQYGGYHPHHPGPVASGHILQIPHGTRVVNVAGQPHITDIGHVPPTVERLNLRGTSIQRLPALPPSVQVLDISGTAIRRLPYLPPQLQRLRARNGALQRIRYLPESLQSIDVAGSRLSSLPNLPHRLRSLNISGTAIATLPVLPPQLRELRANRTPLRVGYVPPSVVVCEIPYPPTATPDPYAYDRYDRRYDRRDPRYDRRDRRYDRRDRRYDRRDRRWGRSWRRSRSGATVRVRGPNGGWVQTDTYDAEWERARRQRAY